MPFAMRDSFFKDFEAGVFAKRLLIEGDGGAPAAGGGSTTAAPAASTTAAAPPASTGAFDWKVAGGVDDLGLNLVTERQWKNPGDLLKSYTNLEKLTGVPADQIVKLPKTADAKEWNDVYAKLGRPETADKYVIPVPEGDKGEFAGVAKGWFHEAGVSQSQATKLAEKWNGFVSEQTKQAEAKQTETNQIQINALKQAWGADYDKNAGLVDKAAEAFGMSQEIVTALKNAAGPKAAMEFLHKIGSKLGVEDSVVPGINAPGGNFAMTPEQAQAKMQALRKSAEFVQLFSSSDPKARMEAREQMDRLAKIAYPGAQSYGSSGGVRS